jgi:signal transduction histidine kinase
VRFKYMLEGYDPQWVDGEGRRAARYTRLPPGRYTFRVMAANNDGVWSTEAATLGIRQLPRFYQTSGFLFLAALAMVGTLWGGHRWRVAALVARERLLAKRVEERTTALKREIEQHMLTAESLATERDLRQAGIKREVLAEERTRMARELHDSLAQNFAGLFLQLESVAVDLPADAGSSRASLEVAAGMLRHAQAEARRAVWDLRSPSGEAASLREALERAVDPMRQAAPLRIEVHVVPANAVLPRVMQRQVVRIADEAVANAVNHARAALVALTCRVDASEVLLEVRDDGRGFVDFGAEAAEAGHFGLLGMRERASSLGGTLEIESQPGRGTCVRLRCPVRPPEPA